MSTKHKACIHCETRIPLAVAVCPFCGGRQPDPRAALAAEKAAADAPAGGTPGEVTTTQRFAPVAPERPDSAAPAPAPPPPPRALRDARFAAGPKARAARSGRLFWTRSALVVIAAGLAVWRFAPRALDLGGLEPYGALASGQPSPCADRPVCIIAFLTPWDPASARTANTLQRLQGLLAGTEVGIAAVIGSDARAELEAFADELPVPTWLDVDGQLEARTDLNTAPTWFVLDARGRLSRSVEGTYFPLDYHLGKLGLRLEGPEG